MRSHELRASPVQIFVRPAELSDTRTMCHTFHPPCVVVGHARSALTARAVIAWVVRPRRSIRAGGSGDVLAGLRPQRGAEHARCGPPRRDLHRPARGAARSVLLTTLAHAAAHADGLVSVVLVIAGSDTAAGSTSDARARCDACERPAPDAGQEPAAPSRDRQRLAGRATLTRSGSRCRSLLPLGLWRTPRRTLVLHYLMLGDRTYVVRIAFGHIDLRMLRIGRLQREGEPQTVTLGVLRPWYSSQNLPAIIEASSVALPLSHAVPLTVPVTMTWPT
jgi:hypothetical protein